MNKVGLGNVQPDRCKVHNIYSVVIQLQFIILIQNNIILISCIIFLVQT